MPSSHSTGDFSFEMLLVLEEMQEWLSLRGLGKCSSRHTVYSLGGQEVQELGFSNRFS